MYQSHVENKYLLAKRVCIKTMLIIAHIRSGQSIYLGFLLNNSLSLLPNMTFLSILKWCSKPTRDLSRLNLILRDKPIKMYTDRDRMTGRIDLAIPVCLSVCLHVNYSLSFWSISTTFWCTDDNVSKVARSDYESI